MMSKVIEKKLVGQTIFKQIIDFIPKEKFDLSESFFRDVYFMLIEHFRSTLSVIKIDNVSFSELFIFDLSTIRLFLDVMKGVGRNPKNEGRKKVGLEVQMMIDAHSDTPTFVRISETKKHDKNFL